jgi:hypothetical protein
MGGGVYSKHSDLGGQGEGEIRSNTFVQLVVYTLSIVRMILNKGVDVKEHSLVLNLESTSLSALNNLCSPLLLGLAVLIG